MVAVGGGGHRETRGLFAKAPIKKIINGDLSLFGICRQLTHQHSSDCEGSTQGFETFQPEAMSFVFVVQTHNSGGASKPGQCD